MHLDRGVSGAKLARRLGKTEAHQMALFEPADCGTGGRWFEPTQLYQRNQQLVQDLRAKPLAISYHVATAATETRSGSKSGDS
jgi:hypothetical protein